MASKARETTSVSTLVNKVQQLVEYAVAHKRRDILKFVVEYKPQVEKLSAEYDVLRKAIDPLHAICFPKLVVADSDVALALAALEAEAAEALENATKPE